MKKAKQGILILVFFGLLVGIAAAPTLVTRYYNGRLLNAVVQREIPPEEFPAAEGIWEKLDIVAAALSAGTFFADTTEEYDAAETEPSYAAAHMLEEELGRLLGEMAIQIHDLQEAYSERILYFDRKRIGTPVCILHTIAETPDYLIDAYRDAETGMIYDMTLHITTGLFSRQAPEHLEDAGRNYLNLEAEGDPLRGWLDVAVDEVYGERGSEALHLYLYGYDVETERATLYKFSRDWKNISISANRSRVQVVDAGSVIDYWD